MASDEIGMRVNDLHGVGIKVHREPQVSAEFDVAFRALFPKGSIELRHLLGLADEELYRLGQLAQLSQDRSWIGKDGSFERLALASTLLLLTGRFHVGV